MSRCFIPVPVLSALYSEATRLAPLETGGVLLGAESGGDLWIDAAVDAGPLAIHEPTRFVPDHDYQEHAIGELYRSSGRSLEYLGDWHSHPDGSENLSRSDIQTLNSIAAFGPARQSSPIMMIIWGGPQWKPSVWRMARRKPLISLQGRIDRLEPILIAQRGEA